MRPYSLAAGSAAWLNSFHICRFFDFFAAKKSNRHEFSYDLHKIPAKTRQFFVCWQALQKPHYVVVPSGDGYIVTLHKARHTTEAYIKPATDSDMELLLPAMLAGIVYQQAIVDVAASLPVDAAACTTLATAAAELERKATELWAELSDGDARIIAETGDEPVIWIDSLGTAGRRARPDNRTHGRAARCTGNARARRHHQRAHAAALL